jgi:hypothetical protein
MARLNQKNIDPAVPPKAFGNISASTSRKRYNPVSLGVLRRFASERTASPWCRAQLFRKQQTQPKVQLASMLAIADDTAAEATTDLQNPSIWSLSK